MYLYQYTIRIEWNFSDIIFQKYLKNKYWKDQNPSNKFKIIQKFQLPNMSGRSIMSVLHNVLYIKLSKYLIYFGSLIWRCLVIRYFNIKHNSKT